MTNNKSSDIVVKAGVGVVIRNGNKVLIGKRKGSHGSGVNAFPGGHLDAGDCFTERNGFWVCGEREVKEETGMTIQCFSPDGCRDELFTTPDIMSEDGKKLYVTTYVVADYLHGGKQICVNGKEAVEPLEPDKCEMWYWVTIDDLIKMVGCGKQRQWIPINQVVKYLKDICEQSGYSVWLGNESIHNAIDFPTAKDFYEAAELYTKNCDKKLKQSNNKEPELFVICNSSKIIKFYSIVLQKDKTTF